MFLYLQEIIQALSLSLPLLICGNIQIRITKMIGKWIWKDRLALGVVQHDSPSIMTHFLGHTRRTFIQVFNYSVNQICSLRKLNSLENGNFPLICYNHKLYYGLIASLVWLL